MNKELKNKACCRGSGDRVSCGAVTSRGMYNFARLTVFSLFYLSGLITVFLYIVWFAGDKIPLWYTEVFKGNVESIPILARLGYGVLLIAAFIPPLAVLASTSYVASKVLDLSFETGEKPSGILNRFLIRLMHRRGFVVIPKKWVEALEKMALEAARNAGDYDVKSPYTAGLCSGRSEASREIANCIRDYNKPG